MIFLSYWTELTAAEAGSSFRRALRFEGDGFMTTLTSTPAATAQQASAVAVLPAEDLDCNAGGDCFYCACPETD